MFLAEGWADPAVLVAILSVVATVVIGVVAAIVTRRAAYPKRELDYSLTKSARLLSGPAGLSDGRLVVSYDGNALLDPYIVEIKLLNGDRDIPASLFDSGAPIVIDLAVPIIELIETVWEDWNDGSPVHHTPVATASGSALTIEPTLIPADLMTTFTVLVEGEPTLDFSAPLVDVKISENRRLAVPRRSSQGELHY
ncbi:MULTISPECIES: hypothetical protein [Streptomyces]|uniref:hypothetical protein n=1 Tax=Streptomyces TaxID=1883 RepID=UPI001677CD42|nr:hypothetical protein [Streptomyces viridodiastaticus]GHG00459.1 hypothetical protein GCM10018777_08860 [Streptomyces viridodiastaticus]